MRRILAIGSIAVAILLAAAFLHLPGRPVPPQWDPFEPLQITDPKTPLTRWKIAWAEDEPALCARILAENGQLDRLEDLMTDGHCGISPRFKIRQTGAAKLSPVETTCATALRLALWEHHGLQPAAQKHLGQEVTRIHHFGSYSCRPIRGSTTRWSTHAQAMAIDISGFDLKDGQRITLLNDWTAGDAKAAFLKDIRNAACQWFGTTLGPEFNALHADHFHFQVRGRGTCR